MKKSLIAIVLVLSVCLSLCACGISRENAVGTWSGTYVYEGNTFSCTFVLYESGEYDEVTYKNGSFSSSENGTWEIDGGKVVLHEDGNMGVSTIYKYKSGALVNNNHRFTKS